jgi:3-isopropylmalate dehydrogenase
VAEVERSRLAKVRPEQGLLQAAQIAQRFANIRPVKVFDALADASPLKRSG